jgi:hypothetical protein
VPALWTWWDNGIPKEWDQYAADKLVGVYRWFLENGDLWQERDYGPPARD